MTTIYLKIFSLVELWCWRRFIRVPWTARRSNQSILKEINPEYSLEGLMLKLKLQYFGHLMQRTDSLERILMLGKIEGRRRRGWQRMRWLAVHGVTELDTTEQLNLTELVKKPLTPTHNPSVPPYSHSYLKATTNTTSCLYRFAYSGYFI